MFMCFRVLENTTRTIFIKKLKIDDKDKNRERKDFNFFNFTFNVFNFLFYYFKMIVANKDSRT
jgi:hypothetical protein